jgi:MoaA/NifB/PqqE/SkfB family radical SAM enzyme
LRAAGVDRFSVSLDIPDERHDDFRLHPGLYDHLSRMVPRLAALGHDDIVLNTCITSQNLLEIPGYRGPRARMGREYLP